LFPSQGWVFCDDTDDRRVNRFVINQQSVINVSDDTDAVSDVVLDDSGSQSRKHHSSFVVCSRMRIFAAFTMIARNTPHAKPIMNPVCIPLLYAVWILLCIMGTAPLWSIIAVAAKWER
jgi:hypothetical protein